MNKEMSISYLLLNHMWKEFEESLECESFIASVANMLKSNSDSFGIFIKDIPDNLVRKLILMFPKYIINILGNYYEQRFNIIIKEILNTNPELFLECSDSAKNFATLLSDDDIITLLSSYINSNDLLCNNDYIFIRKALCGNHSYKNLNKMNATPLLKNIYIAPNGVNRRPEMEKKLSQLVVDMLEFSSHSCVEVANILIPCALEISRLIRIEKNELKPIAEALNHFPFIYFYSNSIFGYYFESKSFGCLQRSTFSYLFDEIKMDRDLFNRQVLIEPIFKELYDQQSAPTSILIQAASAFFQSKSHDGLLMLQRWSKIEGHPIHNAFDRILEILKNSIVKELTYSGCSFLFQNLVGLIENAVSRSPDFNRIWLSFDTVINMIESIIRQIFSMKKELVITNPNRYSNTCILMMTSMIHHFETTSISVLDRPSDLFRSTLSFINQELRDQLVHECILNPASGYANPMIELLGMALRVSDICNVGENLGEHGDKYGFIGNQCFPISTLYSNPSKQIVLDGRMSVFETKLLSTNFFRSNDQQIFIDGIATYINYLTELQIKGILTNDIELMREATTVHKRLLQVLLCKTSDQFMEKQLRILAEVIASPLSMIVGLRSNQDYANDLINTLDLVPSSPVNVPSIVFGYAVRSSYLEGYPEVEEVCCKIVPKLLSLMFKRYESASAVEFIEPSFSVYWCAYGNFKELTKQYMDQIEDATVSGKNDVTLMSEQEQKLPKIMIGRSLNTAISVFTNMVKSTPLDIQRKAKETTLSFLKNTCKIMLKVCITIPIPEEIYQKYIDHEYSCPREISIFIDESTTEFLRHIFASHPFGYLNGDEVKYVSMISQLNIEGLDKVLNEKEPSSVSATKIDFTFSLPQNLTKKFRIINEEYQKAIITDLCARNINEVKTDITNYNNNIEKYNELFNTSYEKISPIYLPEIPKYDEKSKIFKANDFLVDEVYKMIFSHGYEVKPFSFHLSTLAMQLNKDIEGSEECVTNIVKSALQCIIKANTHKIDLVTDAINVVSKLSSHKLILDNITNELKAIYQLSESFFEEFIGQNNNKSLEKSLIDIFINFAYQNKENEQVFDMLKAFLKAPVFKEAVFSESIFTKRPTMVRAILKNLYPELKEFNATPIVDIACILLQRVAISKEEIDFVCRASKMSMCDRDCKKFLSHIALNVKLHYVYEIDVTKDRILSILFNCTKNICDGNMNASVPVIAQLIDSKSAIEAFKESGQFNGNDQNPKDFAPIMVTDLSYPRTGAYKEFFDLIMKYFLCTSLLSKQSHIAYLATSVVVPISDSDQSSSWSGQIHVQTLTGKRFTFEVNGTDRIEDIKEMIHYKDGIPVEQQHLVFPGKKLEDENTLNDYSIRSGSTFMLFIRPHGGYRG